MQVNGRFGSPHYLPHRQNLPQHIHGLSQRRHRQRNRLEEPSSVHIKSTTFPIQILGLGMIALPASFVNSFLDFINKRLSLRFRRRLTDFFHHTYLKDMIYYQLGNLDSRISNPDQRMCADIEKWANALSTIYSNFSKPTLDIILFSKKLA